MKPLYYIIALTIAFSCKSKISNVNPNNIDSSNAKRDSITLPVVYQYILNFKDKNIKNHSDRIVDVLYNGINNYLAGKANANVRFQSECMRCLNVQQYNEGILFGKQLIINNNNISYLSDKIDIPDSVGIIPNVSLKDRRSQTFRYKDVSATMKFTGISCNDADFNRVELSYDSGKITVDSLINASLFEFDLDRDGFAEQFLIGVRNCSQELVILRLRK